MSFSFLNYFFNGGKEYIIQNQDISKKNCIFFLENQIVKEFFKAKIKISSIESSKNVISFTCCAKNSALTHKTLKKIMKIYGIQITNKITDFMTEKPKNICSIKSNNEKGIKQFIVTIQVFDMDALIKNVNKQDVWNIFQRLDSQVYLKNNNDMSVVTDNLKKSVIEEKIKNKGVLTIRYVVPFGRGTAVKNNSGRTFYVSDPILERSTIFNLIEDASVFEDKVLVVKLSPNTVEQLKTLAKSSPGQQLCFELDGVGYNIFALKTQNIKQMMELEVIEDKKKAIAICKLLNSQIVPKLKIVGEKNIEKNAYSNLFLVLLALFNLLLLGLYLSYEKRKKYLFAYFVSVFAFVFFIGRITKFSPYTLLIFPIHLIFFLTHALLYKRTCALYENVDPSFDPKEETLQVNSLLGKTKVKVIDLRKPANVIKNFGAFTFLPFSMQMMSSTYHFQFLFNFFHLLFYLFLISSICIFCVLVLTHSKKKSVNL